MTRNKIALALLASAVLVGCSSPGPSPSPPLAPSSTFALPTDTPSTVTPTRRLPGFLLATLSPRPPSLSLEEQEQLVTLLASNGGCDLPCYLGIEPGQTSWGDASSLLESFNRVYRLSDQFPDGDWPIYSVSLDVLTPAGGILYSLLVTVGEGVVQRIHVYHETHDYQSFYTYWSRYSLRSMLQQLGPPDQLFVNIWPGEERAYGLLVIDEDERAAIWLEGQRQSPAIVCPQFGDGDEITNLQVSLANPTGPLGILPSSWIPYTDSAFWRPVDEVLGLDAQSFYERMLADQPACFTVVAQGP